MSSNVPNGIFRIGAFIKSKLKQRTINIQGTVFSPELNGPQDGI